MKYKSWSFFFSLTNVSKAKPNTQLYGEAQSQLRILPIRPFYSSEDVATEGTE